MLINCVAYQDGRRLGDIARAEISDYLARPGCFVWVALKDPDGREMAEMQEEFGLHALAVEDAARGHQRPKIDEYGDSLFVVLKVPELRGGEEVHVGELDVFAGPNYVLSVRHGFERGFQQARARAEAQPELLRMGSGFVLYALMDDVVDRYFPVVDALEVQLEQIEASIFLEESARGNLKALYALKHRVMAMRHATEPLLDVMHKLFGGRVPRLCVGVQDYFRDVYDHLLRVSTQLDGVRDMLVTAMSVTLSTVQMASTDITKRLAAYAALVAVPTLIAGVYGMNFKHMPELSQEWGYPMALAIMFTIDFVLWRNFRKKGWL